MTDLPSLSIVTPCFNPGETIWRCLDSVWQQHDQVLEHIVIDAGSSDGTPEKLALLAAERDGFLRIETRADRGISHGFNRGIALARGDWVGIVNADDWYMPDILIQIREEMAKGPAVVHGRIRQHDPVSGLSRDVGKIRYNPDKHFRPLVAMPAQHPSCFLPRSLYEEIGGYGEAYKVAMDYELLLRAHIAGVSFRYLPIVITNFTRGGRSGQQPFKAAREVLAAQILHRGQVLQPCLHYLRKCVSLWSRRLKG